MHFAIVRRREFTLTPYWCDKVALDSEYTNDLDIVKYEEIITHKFNSNYKYYDNIIAHYAIEPNYEIFWSGNLNREPLKNGDSININGLTLTVDRVEIGKHQAYNYYVKEYGKVYCEDYYKRMVSCEESYFNRSKKKKSDKLYKDSWWKTTLREIFTSQ